MTEKESKIKPIGKFGSLTVIEDMPETLEDARKAEEAYKEYVREEEQKEKQK